MRAVSSVDARLHPWVRLTILTSMIVFMYAMSILINALHLSPIAADDASASGVHYLIQIH